MRRSFPRQMASLEAIVAYVREFLAQEGLDPDAASDLDLVLEELFTNLVKYGRGARGDVEIALGRGADGITAQLTETNAEPFDPTLLPEVDVRRPIAERRPGGLGVHLIRRLTNSFRYEYRDRAGVTTVSLKERPFEMRVERDGRVFLAGRLDAAESNRAWPAFQGLRGPTTMDCSRLEYISSAGIAVLMDTYRRLSADGHPLRLVQVAPKVKVILEYAGLAKLLGIS